MQIRARWSDIISRGNSRIFTKKSICVRRKNAICARDIYHIRELARHIVSGIAISRLLGNKIKSSNNFDVVCRVRFYHILVTSLQIYAVSTADLCIRIYKFAK